jgi:hypothetical protein
MLHNRNSKFIVASHYSKTFLHFSKGFAIFCEGDQENMNNGNDTEDNEVVVPQKSNLPSPLLLLLASAISTQAELDTLASPDIIGFSNHTGSNGFIGVIGLNGHINLVSLVGLIVFGLVSNHISLVSLSGLSGLIGFDGFDGFGSLALSDSAASLASKLRSLFDVVGRFGLLSHVNRISLVGSIGFSGISGLANQISLISLSNLAIISLVGSLASFVCRLINLVGIISLGLIASSASVASLACRLISFISLIGSSTHRLFCERLATAVTEATKITWRLKQAAALGVATLRSCATETAASTYYFTVSSLHMHSLVREKMWWWLTLARKRCVGGLPLLANPTTVTCNNTQNNYFLSGFRK